MYKSTYASKAEPRSEAFSEILNRILGEIQSEDMLLASAQKLLLHSVAERDISAQETCHILLGHPLYRSSHQFVLLNLNKEAPRWIRGIFHVHYPCAKVLNGNSFGWNYRMVNFV